MEHYSTNQLKPYPPVARGCSSREQHPLAALVRAITSPGRSRNMLTCIHCDSAEDLQKLLPAMSERTQTEAMSAAIRHNSTNCLYRLLDHCDSLVIHDGLLRSVIGNKVELLGIILKHANCPNDLDRPLELAKRLSVQCAELISDRTLHQEGCPVGRDIVQFFSRVWGN